MGQCSVCHGATAEGTNNGPALTGRYTTNQLLTAFEGMPLGNPGIECGNLQNCETSLANFILSNFAEQPQTDLSDIYYANTRVRRLTTDELKNSLSTLGINLNDNVALPPDTKTNGYSTNSNQLIYSTLMSQILWGEIPKHTEDLAFQLAQAVDCPGSVNTWNASCARNILQLYASRAYRRPVSTNELNELVEIFSDVRESEGFFNSLSFSLLAVLQSPDFLYRSELGGNEQNNVITLNNYEIASALSYWLTGLPPDDALFAAVDTLDDANVREAQARRLLSTPAAKQVLKKFAQEWLYTTQIYSASPDSSVFPNWSNVREAVANEAGDFFATAVIDEDANLAEIYTANWTVGDEVLRDYYDATVDGNKLILPSSERAGILTRGAVMASFATPTDPSPVRRGKLVRTRILCHTQLPPPDDLVTSPPNPDPTLTNRQRWADRTSDPSCTNCHTKMNPLGFAFENYDSTGAWRDLDNNLSVDASGELTGTDFDGFFNDAVDLSSLLSQSEEVHTCFARNILEYAMGAEATDESVSVLLNEEPDFVSGDATIKDLLIALARSERFIQRQAQ